MKGGESDNAFFGIGDWKHSDGFSTHFQITKEMREREIDTTS